MKEALLEKRLRKMRLSRVMKIIREKNYPSLLDVGCGWEARLLREAEDFISCGVGVDFKAPNLKTPKIRTFSYFFEAKDSLGAIGGAAAENLAGDFGGKNVGDADAAGQNGAGFAGDFADSAIAGGVNLAGDSSVDFDADSNCAAGGGGGVMNLLLIAKISPAVRKTPAATCHSRMKALIW